MCAIVGSFAFNRSGFRVTEPFVVKMRDAMAHRGPDGSGVWISEDAQLGLGHRRLAIIDLSDSAAQPMQSDDASLVLVFNGEIYNHADIRKELSVLGVRDWRTDHSDTEVILRSFEYWGIHCIHRFRGMFAFAIWDSRAQELWLARDRIGVKPLYYSIHNGRLNFASEIKALLQDPQQERRVNEYGLFHYLSFLTTPAPQTLFEGIYKLPSGSWMRIDADGCVKEQRYWDPMDNVQSSTHRSESQTASDLLACLNESVSLRKVSDVPVGVFLSGGIDSSTNAALFSKGNIDGLKTFSIGYAGNYDSNPDELAYAKQMAAALGALSFEARLSVDDLLGFLPKMIRLQDEPIADPVCFPLYFLSKLARDNGVVVCQVGEGADELFWGYPGWKTSLRLQQYSDWPLPRFFKTLGLFLLRMLGRELSFSYEWLRRGSINVPIFWGGAEAFTETHKQRLLSPRLRNKLTGISSWDVIAPIRSRFESKICEKSTLNWMTYLDLNMRLPELLLMRVDKMSMGVGVEARVPFLDHKLVEFAFSIPQSLKTKDGILKSILKKAVRGLIPDNVIDRKKQGFGVPIHEWFFDKLGVEIEKELSDFCSKTDFFDPLEVKRLIKAREATQVWYLFNFALWWKEYIRE